MKMQKIKERKLEKKWYLVTHTTNQTDIMNFMNHIKEREIVKNHMIRYILADNFR